MNCRHEWNREFIDANFTRSWINGELRRHRQNLLWDRERSLLPATQPAVEVTLQIRQIREVDIPRLTHQSFVSKQQINLLSREWFNAKFRAHFDKECDHTPAAYEQFNAAGCAHSAEHYISNVRQIPVRETCATCKAALKERIPEFRRRWTELTIAIRNAKAQLTVTKRALFNIEFRLDRHIHRGAPLTDGEDGGADPLKERRQFIAACPSEDCRGFLSSAYKCGVCQKQFCASCRELKAEDHECDPALVETIKAIVKDSRACPSCGTAISKIDGCDQMYCTLCFTAFSYRTGDKVTGPIHNPHYFERMRALHGGVVPPQTAGAGAGAGAGCREELSVDQAFNMLVEDVDYATIRERDPTRVFWGMDGLTQSYEYHNARRLVHHITDYYLRDNYFLGARRFPRRTDPIANANTDLRVKYLLNQIDEKKFKQTIQTREKDRQKGLELRDVYELYMVLVTDFFATAATKEDVPRFLAMIEEFVNEPLKAISARYKNRVEIFDLSTNRMVWYKDGAEEDSILGAEAPLVTELDGAEGRM